MEIKEVYDKYKHMDKLLSDNNLLSDDPLNKCLFDFWQAIKYHINKNEN